MKAIADEVGGVAVPAHLDRSSYSALSNLGMLPDIGFNTVEVSKKTLPENYAYLGKKIIQNSDAHYLENISEREYAINGVNKNEQKIYEFLCKF